MFARLDALNRHHRQEGDTCLGRVDTGLGSLPVQGHEASGSVEGTPAASETTSHPQLSLTAPGEGVLPTSHSHNHNHTYSHSHSHTPSTVESSSPGLQTAYLQDPPAVPSAATTAATPTPAVQTRSEGQPIPPHQHSPYHHSNSIHQQSPHYPYPTSDPAQHPNHTPDALPWGASPGSWQSPDAPPMVSEGSPLPASDLGPVSELGLHMYARTHAPSSPGLGPGPEPGTGPEATSGLGAGAAPGGGPGGGPHLNGRSGTRPGPSGQNSSSDYPLEPIPGSTPSSRPRSDRVLHPGEPDFLPPATPGERPGQGTNFLSVAPFFGSPPNQLSVSPASSHIAPIVGDDLPPGSMEGMVSHLSLAPAPAHEDLPASREWSSGRFAGHVL